jgi:hypothetical protein
MAGLALCSVAITSSKVLAMLPISNMHCEDDSASGCAKRKALNGEEKAKCTNQEVGTNNEPCSPSAEAPEGTTCACARNPVDEKACYCKKTAAGEF